MSLSKLVLLVTATWAAADLSESFVHSELIPAINNLINTYPPNDRDDVLESQAPHPLNGAILRLAFHDCAGAGGCDGCLGLTLPENAGLDYPIKALDGLHSALQLKDLGVSRADLWAIAAQVVVANRMKSNATDWKLPSKLNPKNFKYGRKDCATTPISLTDVSSNFPGAFLTTSQVASYFALRFAYDAKQTVAIMGAHHVGRMHERNSGFKGAWVPDEKMDGQFYSNLVTLTDWHQEVVNCSVTPFQQKVSWEATLGDSTAVEIDVEEETGTTSADSSSCSECQESYMLDADMAIFKDIGAPRFNGAVSCSFSTCPYASTLSEYTKLYASNGAQFQRDFASVFDIMLSVCSRRSSGAPKWCVLSTVGADTACRSVSVERDATYCITGSLCSGPTNAAPAGVTCPRKGDRAVANCFTTLPSWNGNGACVAPSDASCVPLQTGAWGCAYENLLAGRTTGDDATIDSENTGNSALYALFAIPGVVVVASVVGVGIYRHMSNSLVELRDIDSGDNEQPKNTVTPANRDEL